MAKNNQVNRSNKIRRSKEDVVFDVINYIMLFFILIVVLYPLYFVVIASFSDPQAVNLGQVLFLPKDITLNGYERIFESKSIWSSYRNTIKYTMIGTVINITLTMMLAYPLSRKSFSGRKYLMIFLMITMYFSGGLIPTYLTVQSYGLVNKWPVLIVLGAVGTYNVIMARVVLQNSVPDELLEAAQIDGCSQLRFFVSFVLPLSNALMAVLALYYGVGHWNDYFTALIYLKDEAQYPLQLILRSILVQNNANSEMLTDIVSAAEAQKTADLLKYGIIIVSTVPILMVYPFLQKYFNKGVMMGSLKG